jgi:hypothetical protein
VEQSAVGKSLRLVMTQWVRHLATSDAYINRDFEVDLYKAMEVFVSAKTRRADFGQF